MTLFTRLLIASLFSLTSALAYAEVAGTVIMATGQVIAKDAQGTERTLTRRSSVYEQDTIITASNARVQIRFIDNALLALTENSQLNIKHYQQAKAQGQESKVIMQLIEGGFRSLTGSIGKGTADSYQIQTPAASIGIRGTLFSVLLNGDELLAGVWQGGIRLTSTDGSQYDLGQDSPYQFGVLGSHGFVGLLTAPQGLDSAPAGAPATESSTDDEQNPAAADDSAPSASAPAANAPSEVGSTAAPLSPIEQLDASQIAATLEQQKVPAPSKPDTPPTPSPQPDPVSGDPRLSLAEWQTYSSLKQGAGEMAALMSTPTQSADGLVWVGDNYSILFKEDNRHGSTGEQLYRFTGSPSTPYNTQGNDYDVNELIPNLVSDSSWGMWEYDANSPAAIQGSVDTTTPITNVNENVYWALIDPSPSQVIPSTGSVSLNAWAAIGEDSLGHKVQELSGQMTIDFATGVINDGYLSLDYAPAPSSQEGFNWNMSFTGTIQENGQNSPYITIANSPPSMGYQYNAASGAGTDVSITSKGALIGKDAVQGAMGVYQLSGKYTDQMQNEQSISANAVIVWGVLPP